MADEKCDGNCYGHEGPVRKVLVSGFPDKTFEPLDLWYCSVAINKDTKAGFKVEDAPHVRRLSPPSDRPLQARLRHGLQPSRLNDCSFNSLFTNNYQWAMCPC